MDTGLMLYVVSTVSAGLLGLFLCAYSFFKLKNTPGVLYFGLLNFAVAFFAFMYTFELLSTSLEQVAFWLKLEYLALPFIPALTLFMILDYVGEQVKTKYKYMYLLLPLMTIFFHHTNSMHGLYYSDMEMMRVSNFEVVKLTYGPWYYVHSLYLFVTLVISTIVAFTKWKGASFRFKMQLLFLVTGILFPIIGGHMYMNGLSPDGVDLGPVFLSISLLFFTVSLFIFQLFDVVPIAKEKIFDNMQEGILVVNKYRVLLDFNQAAERIFPILSSTKIGSDIDTLFLETEELASALQGDTSTTIELKREMYVQLIFTPIYEREHYHIGTIISILDVSERVQMERRMFELASIDSLTQVFNRRYFIEKTEEVLANDPINSVGMIMFDIDFFKRINDTHGHQAGDEVLIQIASLIKSSLRENEMVGRYGGEEFIFVTWDAPPELLYERAEELRIQLEQLIIFYNEKELKVTSSFGVTYLSVTDLKEIDLQELIRIADKNLYQAKELGRNRVVFSESLVH
ncbi:histidine kinase N-terminal 7TM domain-containing protein [Mangrovibacillus cuniculi]|uniref:Diguanylate cyclase n=1 Tax=Mangrovibacillus cuniculi TaxID=2593652 RepID=A0A7S8HEG3_9BACI|nr:histidine kinase N-terminal 7TM domain-containing protein [Mangrovibacillus cuniculi]QPC45682.1 diguanylate cyclase [Mangrovibacillus cuniculi]